jgi:anaerobic selenocysteine-containing dehydrogenase
MAPADAQRLGLSEGAHVVVGSNGTSVRATVALRQATPPGSVFLQEGIPGADSGNALGDEVVEVRPA